MGFNSIKFRLIIIIAFGFSICTSIKSLGQEQNKNTSSWGDQYNGTYKNPIINADYSDPDVIRVGNHFYMVCSDFHYMGMPVLESEDLVNWHIITQIYKSLDIDPGYNSMKKYGEGSWAPTIRYHNKRFYIYFCTPNEGLFMASANNAAGPWSALVEVKRVKGWEDPCPFWDNDGQAYLGHSVLGAGPIIIHRLSSDGKQLLDSGRTVYKGDVAEGTKIYKRHNYYYLIIPEGGVGTGYETALRSKSIYGPYERKVVLEQGKTKINGPHQGGWVELNSGQSWFIHFQDAGAIGRVCFLEPVTWKNDWPFIGIDNNANGIGEPVDIYKMPAVNRHKPHQFIQTSDEFNIRSLGLQWQWNHNPVATHWAVNLPKGYLRLQAMQAADNHSAKNTLTQKLMGRSGLMTTLLNTSQMSNGQKAGICLLGNYIHEIGIVKMGDSCTLYKDNNGKFTKGIVIHQDNIHLRIKVDLDINNGNTLEYSLDGNKYYQLGQPCLLSNWNFWKGVRPGLFSYNTQNDSGTALFDWFHYTYDGMPRESSQQ